MITSAFADHAHRSIREALPLVSQLGAKAKPLVGGHSLLPAVQRGAMALAFASSLVLCFAGQAQEGPWLVRLRAVNLDSANNDSTGLGLTINKKVIPEVGLWYFFLSQVAAELIPTYP